MSILRKEHLQYVFGYNTSKKKKRNVQDKAKTFTVSNPEGAFISNARAVDQYSFEAKARTEFELIDLYRRMALSSEISRAVEEICNEAIVQEEDKVPVEISLENVDLSESVKNTIREEFEYLLGLLNFKERGFEIFRKWYVDSRIVYHKAINLDKEKDGILAIYEIDPRRIIRIKQVAETPQDNQSPIFSEVMEEYFAYFPGLVPYDQDSQFGFSSTARVAMGASFGQGQQPIKLLLDTVAFIDSGLIDQSSSVIYGWLQSAIKNYNMLSSLEDVTVINAIARSGQKRVFYIETGNMPMAQAYAYVEQVKSAYRNKITYDAFTGEYQDDKRHLALTDDFFIPRRGGNSTQIDTLEQAQNLDETDHLSYFRNKLYESLHVPSSRYNADSVSQSGLFGRGGEISREELKFSKFITRLRTQFSHLFYNLLETQLILKQIIDQDEWDEIRQNIQFNFLKDSFWTEARDIEVMKMRMEAVGEIKELIGTVFSLSFVEKNILKMSEDERKQMQKEIKAEKSRIDAFKGIEAQQQEESSESGDDFSYGNEETNTEKEVKKEMEE